MNRYYDVVVLGRSIGSLAVAALLARRELHVLLLGHGQRPSSYQWEERTLLRRAFTMLAAPSPAWGRILHELAQRPTFRRHLRTLDPMFGLLTSSRRVTIPPNADLFAREVDREFPEVRQLVDEMYSTFASVNSATDDAVERDVVWPPGTFWERIETARVTSSLPLTTGAHDLLAKFPVEHAYRDIVSLPARFATDLAREPLPPLALARLHGAWTRGAEELVGGEDLLETMLIERIEAHGGVCRLDSRAESIVIRNGRVAGVREDGEEEPLGTSAVLSNSTGEQIAELAFGEGITKAARNDWPHVSAAAGRFVTSIIVRSACIPEPLPREAFLLPARGDARRVPVHLQRLADRALPGETLLVAEALVPSRGPLTLLEARESILSTVRDHLPFLDEHLLVVDSPHDGLPLYDFTAGVRREIDRLHVTGATSGPEPPRLVWAIDPPGHLGLAGEPIRGPILGTFLVGSTVLPALGQEGELIAAWGAARLQTRRDRRRQRMRRQMWSRVETG